MFAISSEIARTQAYTHPLYTVIAFAGETRFDDAHIAKGSLFEESIQPMPETLFPTILFIIFDTKFCIFLTQKGRPTKCRTAPMVFPFRTLSVSSDEILNYVFIIADPFGTV